MSRFDRHTEIVGRGPELNSLSSFLDASTVAFLIEGEAGIGKSALWRAGVAMARDRRHRVLSCAAAEAEAGFAYSALGDLLDPVPGSVLAELPGPQRQALKTALLRAEADGPVDERAVAVFHVMEIARALGSRADPPAPGEPLPVPASLRDLVVARVAELPEPTREALLAASALATPTRELIQSLDRRRRVTRVLAPAERADLIVLDGDRLHFAHPLIASAIYTGADRGRRRALHERLARLAGTTEERARHLALAVDGPSEQVTEALDSAASTARVRGAPDAAAKLCELAADATPPGRPDVQRRRRTDAAEHHFVAGERQRARRLLEHLLPECQPGGERARVLRLLGELRFHDDSFPEAARLLRLARDEAGDDLTTLSAIECDLTYVTHTREGAPVAAAHAQAAVAAAEKLGEPGPLAEALAVAAMMTFIQGGGVDERAFQRALSLEDLTRRVPAPIRPSLIHATVMFWSGRPEPAHASLDRLSERLAERGDETAVPLLAFVLAFNACMRGAVLEAERHAREGMQAAERVGTDILRAHALTAVAVTDAYAGRADAARQTAEQAAALFERVGCRRWAT